MLQACTQDCHELLCTLMRRFPCAIRCEGSPPRIRKVKQDMQCTFRNVQSCSSAIGTLFSLPSATLFREELGSYRGDQMSAWGRISRQTLKVCDLLSTASENSHSSCSFGRPHVL
jgi:hypothetical protein